MALLLAIVAAYSLFAAGLALLAQLLKQDNAMTDTTHVCAECLHDAELVAIAHEEEADVDIEEDGSYTSNVSYVEILGTDCCAEEYYTVPTNIYELYRPSIAVLLSDRHRSELTPGQLHALAYIEQVFESYNEESK